MDKPELPAGITLPEGMKEYKLPAGKEKLEFWGRFLDKSDTDSGERLRWAELRLYKIIGTEKGDGWGVQSWLLYTIGHSLVYHTLDSACNRGIRARVRDFPGKNEDWADLEPCPGCSPPGLPGINDGDDEFELEITWYSYARCQDPGDVIRALSRCETCRHKPHESRCRCGCEDRSEVLSAPGRRLIEQVRDLDPEIHKATEAVRRF